VSLSREEKEKFVLEFYYTKGYTYKQITKELRMLPNQIRAIIKKHEEKPHIVISYSKWLNIMNYAFVISCIIMLLSTAFAMLDFISCNCKLL
jgi:hypothetical protein